MSNSIICRHFFKVCTFAIMLMGLLVGLLACPTSTRAEEPREVYRDSIGGVVWIVNYVGKQQFQGSGFLVDKDRRLVVTNQHVAMGEETMDVFFPVRNNGKLIDDRDYYTKNAPTLKKTGHYNAGRVVAVAPGKDLAILEIALVPSTAVELETASGDPENDDRLYLLGNPAERDLWRYGPGVKPSITTFKGKYKNDSTSRDYKSISYTVSSFGGNSGGPVLNEKGKVVGVHSSGGLEGGGEGGAVHWSEVDKLLDTLKTHRVFSIKNSSNVAIPYQIRWGDGDWKNSEVSANSTMIHWNTSQKVVKPEIRFDCSTAPGFQEKVYDLEYYTRLLGQNVKPSVERDAKEYIFQYDRTGTNLNLHSK